MENTIPKSIGSYRIIGILGQGTMGCVYRAALPLMGGQEYAIKLLWDECKRTEVSAFLGECNKVKRLGVHPHILLIHFAGRDRRSRRYYVVMELVDGPSAAQLLDETPGRQLPLERVVRLAAQVSLGLEHAHQRGVLHLDVKPSNILIQRDGEMAKLADFGNALLLETESWQIGHVASGTPAYMPWEQTPSGRQAGLLPDARSDVYALAATCYELLTGCLPTSAERGQLLPLTHWRADLPEEIEAVLLRALSRDPQQRPAVAEFRQRLEQALAPKSMYTASSLLRPVHTLVGRDHLLEQLKRHLCADRPAGVVLYGLPGVGKTGLALGLADDPDVRQNYPDGVLWAGLGPQPNLSGLLNNWSLALGIPSPPFDRLQQTQAIQEALSERRMLLVIDDAWNVEAAHVFKRGGPQCGYLMTTRLPEVALHFADEEVAIVRVEELIEADGFALLAHLAPEVTKAEPEAAMELVRAVDGLPLALVLIGKHLRVQAHSGQPRRLRTALERLRQSRERLRLAHLLLAGRFARYEQSSGSRSLMASIDTSYQALSKRARSMLLALAIFPAKPNSMSEEAALAVSAGSAKTLDTLVDSGLIETSGPGRYTLHQTIADYARLKRHFIKPHQRMVGFFISYAEQHQADLNALDQETNNILAALQFAVDHTMHLFVVRGVIVVSAFLQARGLYQTLEALLQHAQQAARSLADQAGLATIIRQFGLIAEKQGDYERAQSAYLEALAAARQVGEPEQISTLLHSLGAIAAKHGNYERAGVYYEEGLMLARQQGLHKSTSLLLRNLGAMAENRGAYAQAEAYYEEGLALARQIKHVPRICSLLINLGSVKNQRGDYVHAKISLDEALLLAHQINHREYLIFVLTNLGQVAEKSGELDNAEAYYREGLALARLLNHRELMSALLISLGAMTKQNWDGEQAMASLQEGLALARELKHNWLTIEALNKSGGYYLKHEQVALARAAFEEALLLARESGSQEQAASALFELAQIELMLGKSAEAHLYGQESRTLFESLRHARALEVAQWLETLADEPHG